MPYRLKGSSVQVKRKGRWTTLKKHSSRKKALAHLRAIKANVKH